jgi:hypothetical protein
MASEVLVLGAGMVGVSTALALQQRGRQVVLVDRRPPGRETSYGNAGFIQREAVQPYAFPRSWQALWRVATGQGNDVHVHWTALPSLAGRLLRYWQSSAPAPYANTCAAYARLIAHCIAEHEPLIAAAGAQHLVRKEGWLQLYRKPALLDTALRNAAQVAQAHGLDWLRRSGALLERLAQMLAAVRLALAAHPQVIVAVEVRDPELLTPELARVLKAHGCTYCLGLHGKMPPIEAQLPLLRALWPGPLVCRWSLNRCFGAYGYPDAQKKHNPFNEIRSEDLHTRSVLAATIAGITGAGQPAFVTISNDAEGCAPRSIALLAQALVAAQPQPSQ